MWFILHILTCNIHIVIWSILHVVMLLYHYLKSIDGCCYVAMFIVEKTSLSSKSDTHVNIKI